MKGKNKMNIKENEKELIITISKDNDSMSKRIDKDNVGRYFSMLFRLDNLLNGVSDDTFIELPKPELCSDYYDNLGVSELTYNCLVLSEEVVQSIEDVLDVISNEFLNAFEMESTIHASEDESIVQLYAKTSVLKTALKTLMIKDNLKKFTSDIAWDEKLKGTISKSKARHMLEELTPREGRLLELYYGLLDGKRFTVKEISKEFGIDIAEVDNEIAWAIEKLRPVRHSNYKGFNAYKTNHLSNDEFEEELKQGKRVFKTIDDLDLTIRTSNCLKRAGITLEQLFDLSDDDLMKIPNMGIRSINEIKRRLNIVAKYLNNEKGK